MIIFLIPFGVQMYAKKTEQQKELNKIDLSAVFYDFKK